MPNSLHEWTYVNKKAQFWGLRHYDRQQAKYDPTSPFEGKKSANFPDEGAIGLTYQCDAKTRRATVTYLTAAGADTRKIAADRFPDAGEPVQGTGRLILFYLHGAFRARDLRMIRGANPDPQLGNLLKRRFRFLCHLDDILLRI